MKSVLVFAFCILMSFNSFGLESGGNDLLSKVMKLRLEVEEKNTLWEHEKKRLQFEYDSVLQRVTEVQAEVLRKKSQLEVLLARDKASLVRTERRRVLSGSDRKNLLEAFAEIQLVLSQSISVGRSELRTQFEHLRMNLEEGRGSVDDISTEFVRLLKSELKLSRGMHTAKEEIDVEGEKVAVEAALVGSYKAFFAASDGRVGEWNSSERRPRWIDDASKRKLRLAQLTMIRKVAESAKPVLLDVDLEVK